MSFLTNSNQIEVQLEQHLYTATDPEFETVAQSKGISDEIQHELEKNSLYFLPSEYLYEENQTQADFPLKYIFYALSENHFAIGRGIYIGKDAIGRPGNYVFHNFVIHKSDFAKLDFQPISLFRTLDKENKFLSERVESEKLESLHLKVEPTTSTYRKEIIDLSNLAKLVALSLDNKNTLIRANSKQVLDVSEQVFACLPLAQRLCFHFDSYCYGTGSYSGLNALPEKEFFNDNQNRDFIYHYANQEASNDFQAAPASLQYANRLTTLIEEIGLEKCQHLLKLESTYCRNIEDFLTSIRNNAAEVKKPFFFLFENRLLQSMHDGEVALFAFFFDLIENKNDFFTNDMIMNASLKENHQQIIDELVIYQTQKVLAGEGSALVRNERLWQNFLNYAESSKLPKATPTFELCLSLLQLNREPYDQNSEQQIYRILFSQCENTLLITENAQRLYAILKKYEKVENEALLLLREFFYCIGKNKISGDLLKVDLMAIEPIFLKTMSRFILFHLEALEKEKKIKKWVQKLADSQGPGFLEFLLKAMSSFAMSKNRVLKRQIKTALS